jgi:hypothetical protein
MRCLALTGALKASRAFIYAAIAVFATIVIPVSSRPAYAVTWDNVHFHGYFDFQYLHNTKAEGPDDPSAPDMSNGAFDFRHLTFLFDVSVMQELVIKANMEFDHAVDTELGYGGFILEYGFAEYMFTDWLKLRAGKALTPYGIFNEIHDAAPAYLSVSVPDSVYKADKRGGFSLIPKWITGLYALGMTNPCDGCDLDYTIFIGNGESVGYNEAQFDSNPNKAVGGRVQLSLADDKYMAGVSAYYGDKAVSPTNLAENHWAYVLSLAYNLSDFSLKAEYGQGKLGPRAEYGWYVQPSYKIGRYTPYVRAQSSDPDDRKADDYWNTYLAGLNIQVNKQMFLKFEWRENTRGKNNNDILTPGNEDFGEFKSSVTIYF